MKVKILSIRQPWSYLIVNGVKPVENRSWYTKYRGELYIHAGQKFDHEGYEVAKRIVSGYGGMIPVSQSPRYLKGGIIGSVNMVDCVDECDDDWFFGDWGFVFENAEEIDFIPMSGRLGIFEADIESKKRAAKKLNLVIGR